MRFDAVIDTVEKVAAACLAVVAFLTFCSVLLRYLFVAPVPDQYDISRLLMGILIAWGIAVCSYYDGHIKVDAVWSLLSARWRRVVDFLSTAITLAFMLLISAGLLDRVAAVYGTQEQTFDLRLPIWPWYALAFAGTAMAAIVLVLRLWRTASGTDLPAQSETPSDI